MLCEVDYLVCPIDGLELRRDGSSYVCPHRHCFDIAKHGYINLLPVQHKRSRAPGDNQAMVKARKNFLDSGAYESIAEQMAVALLEARRDGGTALSVLDAGCGEGYYLAYLRRYLSQASPGLRVSLCGVDISKAAIISAAKRDASITWLVGSNKQLPIKAQSMDAVVCMFGFPNFEMFKKVLKAKGRVILINPTPAHLIELRGILYDDVRRTAWPNHDEALALGFNIVDETHFQYAVVLNSSEQIMALAMMTPHYFRAKQAARDRLGQIETLTVSVSVGIRILSL